MANHYYNAEDLAKFGNIGEYQKELADKFFGWYGAAFADGALTAKEKSLRGFLQQLKQDNDEKLFSEDEPDFPLIRVAGIIESLQAEMNNNSLLGWFDFMINETGILEFSM